MCGVEKWVIFIFIFLNSAHPLPTTSTNKQIYQKNLSIKITKTAIFHQSLSQCQTKSLSKRRWLRKQFSSGPFFSPQSALESCITNESKREQRLAGIICISSNRTVGWKNSSTLLFGGGKQDFISHRERKQKSSYCSRDRWLALHSQHFPVCSLRLLP